jgi:G:T-mismatch repair DNA endonuclease (very short patch repair protein)
MWPLEKFLSFKEDALKYDHVFMEAKYSLGKKSFRSICDKLGIRWGWKEGNTFKETLPEKKMASILLELGIKFTRERYVLNMKYRVDFMLTEKKVIEVHGDYLHANPLVFDYSKLSDMQISHVARDMQRRKDFQKAGISLLEVWEKDINENIESVKNKVKVYAEE